MLKEAEQLSRLYVLPVLVGDNERTVSLEFDRSKPTPLAIPVEHYFYMNPEEPVVNEEIKFAYINEFIDFDKSVKFSVLNHKDGEKAAHVFLDASNASGHSMTAYINAGSPLDLLFCVWKDESILHSFEFSVKENNEK